MLRIGYAYFLIVLSTLVMYSFYSSHLLYAQIAGPNMSLLKNTTSGSSLDVLLEPIPYPIILNDSSAKFKISFLKPDTNALQEHVDFNLRIYDNNTRVFQATNLTGQPEVPLHATEGVMTVPVLNYKFNHLGQYRIEIPVYGILFNPIRPEFANFTIHVLG